MQTVSLRFLDLQSLEQIYANYMFVLTIVEKFAWISLQTNADELTSVMFVHILTLETCTQWTHPSAWDPALVRLQSYIWQFIFIPLINVSECKCCLSMPNCSERNCCYAPHNKFVQRPMNLSYLSGKSITNSCKGQRTYLILSLL